MTGPDQELVAPAPEDMAEAARALEQARASARDAEQVARDAADIAHKVLDGLRDGTPPDAARIARAFELGLREALVGLGVPRLEPRDEPEPNAPTLPTEPGAVRLLSPGGVAIIAGRTEIGGPVWMLPDLDGGANWQWRQSGELPATAPARVVPEVAWRAVREADALLASVPLDGTAEQAAAILIRDAVIDVDGDTDLPPRDHREPPVRSDPPWPLVFSALRGIAVGPPPEIADAEGMRAMQEVARRVLGQLGETVPASARPEPDCGCTEDPITAPSVMDLPRADVDPLGKGERPLDSPAQDVVPLPAALVRDLREYVETIAGDGGAYAKHEGTALLARLRQAMGGATS